MKNKDTPEGKAFWEHVEKIAEYVRSRPELFEHKTGLGTPKEPYENVC